MLLVYMLLVKGFLGETFTEEFSLEHVEEENQVSAVS